MQLLWFVCNYCGFICNYCGLETPLICSECGLKIDLFAVWSVYVCSSLHLEVDSLESEQVEELKFELEEKITALNKAELQLVEQDAEINNLRTQLKQTIIPPIPASVTSITSKTNKKLAK